MGAKKNMINCTNYHQWGYLKMSYMMENYYLVKVARMVVPWLGIVRGCGSRACSVIRVGMVRGVWYAKSSHGSSGVICQG